MCRSQGDYENKADGWLNASTHHNLCGVAGNGSSVVAEKQISVLNSWDNSVFLAASPGRSSFSSHEIEALF